MNETEQFIFYLLYIKDNSKLQEQERKFKETIAAIDKLKQDFKNKEKRYEDYCTQCDVIKPIFEKLSTENKHFIYFILSSKEETLKNDKITDEKVIEDQLKQLAHNYLYMLSVMGTTK